MPAHGKWISIAATLCLAFAVVAFAAEKKQPNGNNGDGTAENPYVVPMTSTAVHVDGVLDEEAWEHALTLELPFEFSPGENVAPPVRTQVLLTYDRGHLYAAFRCFDDNPEAIRARLSDREACFRDDHAVIHIDTFNDERSHVCFGGNPRGVQVDSISTGGSFDWSWDMIFSSAARIYDWGWASEFAVPFNQLRFQRSEGAQVWGFDAWRVYPRNKEYYMAAFPHDRNNNCFQCQMIKIEGFEGVSPGRNIEVAPTLTSVRTDTRSEMPDGDFRNESHDTELGITARWGITPNMTLSGTANPDFSQIEADALQLDINEPFALFFSEKRPFFNEGNDFFRTRQSIVYTRMMRDPSMGLKLTGKEGDNTIGAYIVRDELTNIVFPGLEGSDATSLDSANTSSVFRYKRDIGNKYTVGVLATDREGGDYFNRLLSLDADIRITDVDRVTAQAVGSSTRYPLDVAREFEQTEDSFGGHMVDLYYFHGTRSHDWYVGYRDVSEDFRADLGYYPRVGYRLYTAAWGHTWNGKPEDWWSLFNFGTGYEHWEDQQGSPFFRDYACWFDYEGPLQSWAYIKAGKKKEVYRGSTFDQYHLEFESGFIPQRNVWILLNGYIDDRIDYTDVRPGKRLQLNPYLRYNLGLHIRLSLDHTFERMTVEDQRLYTANISQFTAIYQFDTRTFFRTILQYVDYRYNVDNYISVVDPYYRHLFTQFLFSYKINPQTVLFLGYSDNYFGEGAYGLTQSDRTFFVKLGYAWVL